MRTREGRRTHLSIGLVSSASGCLMAGCDPVISVAGANFPVWIFCLSAGILASLVLRLFFVATGLDDLMVPKALVYSSLALIVAFLTWLLIWR